MAADLLSEIYKLEYNIFRYPNYLTSCLPGIEDNLSSINQTSRLSSSTSSSSASVSNNCTKSQQFLTLKLRRPAIIKTIKLCKYEKSNSCMLKKFRVYGGLTENRMRLLLEGSPENNLSPQKFELQYTNDIDDNAPILYLEIVPLVLCGSKSVFNTWYIELYGQDDPMYLATSLKYYNTLQEKEIIKLCLKHFRQQGYDDAFKTLQEQTNVCLEHPIITDLYHYLVNEGNFYKAEYFIEYCVNQGFMDDYLIKQDYKHSWKLKENKSYENPGRRGGHQLVIDTENHLIYLFGGWDGFTDLSDLWCFNIKTDTWKQLYDYSELYGGPTPRSCHKMVFDSITGRIYMLGRYLDNSFRTAEYSKSDFFQFDTKTNSWLQICDDTGQVNGPQLIYDHQMCIDIIKRKIYVFGGKILTPRNVNQISYSAPEYSGLFSYDIITNKWEQLLVDCNDPLASKIRKSSVKSCVTHCMVFHDKKRKLYIYGGQRGREDINEFLSYDVDTNCLNVLNVDKSDDNNYNGITNRNNEPPIGFTQRATIDCDKDEIYIFSSLSKQKDKRDSQQIEPLSNSFWVFSLKTNKWSQIYCSKYKIDDYNTLSQQLSIDDKSIIDIEPCPRYAHQIIYDDNEKIHYLFGGNPGLMSLPQLRLSDFWILLLKKPTRQEILRHCRYLIRKLQYEETIKINPIEAIKYLQNRVSEAIDHSDPIQVKQFHELTFLLFKSEENCNQKLLNDDNYIITENDINQQNFNNEDSLKNDENSVLQNTDSNDDVNIKHNASTCICKDNLCLNTSTITTTTLQITATKDTITAEETKNITKNIKLFDDNNSYELYKKCNGIKSCDDYYFDLKSRRSFLFNKIVQLMPFNMVQPKGNLSDFVFI